MVLVDDYVVAIGKPTAGFAEVFAQMLQHQVDGAATCSACEATVGVATRGEREAGGVFVVEWSQALVVCHSQSEPFCYAFDRKVAQTLNFVLLHNSLFLSCEIIMAIILA